MLVNKIKIWVGNHSGFLLGLGSLAILAVACFCVLFFGDSLDKKEQIPQIHISLNDVSFEEINNGEKSEKYGGNSLRINNGKKEIEFSNIEISGRGNFTWAQDKKNYNLEFEQKIDLFGVGKSKKWVLLANYLDASFLRNDTAFFIEQMLGRKNVVLGKYIELYVDNDYCGLYYIVPKIKINKERMNLSDDFGILVELDNLHAAEEECYLSVENDCIVVKDLVEDGNKELAIQDFMDSFDKFTFAAKKGDYEKVSELIDIKSFAEYYLLSEFTVNPDAYISSFYLYKDGIDDKIHVGPGWDFDLAMANKLWKSYDDTGFYLPSTTQAMRKYSFSTENYDEFGNIVVIEPDLNYSKFMYYLIDMPEFFSEVKNIYTDTMSGRGSELKQHLCDRLALIHDVALRDSEKWGVDFEEESTRLIDWVMKRYNFFEIKYSNNNLIRQLKDAA